MSAVKVFLRPRLLPAVIGVGAALLALKGAGMVHDAKADEMAPPSAQSQFAASDPAADDTQTTSAAEVGVLTSLAKRRAELDAQQRDVAMHENLLAATEKRVDDKIAMLKQLQTEIQQLLSQRDAEQEKQVASLVKTYSAMKPKDAARIFNSLDDDVLVPVAQDMKPDVLGPILSNMQPEAAQKLTVKLASRLRLPDPPPLPMQAAPPAPQAAAAPAPTLDPSALAAALAPETQNGAQQQAAPPPPAPSPTVLPQPAPTGQTANAKPAPQAPAAAGSPAAAGAHGG